MSVADPGFPRGGGTQLPGRRKHTILPNFPKNCMKLKEFGPRGGGARPLRTHLDPPLHVMKAYVLLRVYSGRFRTYEPKGRHTQRCNANLIFTLFCPWISMKIKVLLATIVKHGFQLENELHCMKRCWGVYGQHCVSV